MSHYLEGGVSSKIAAGVERRHRGKNPLMRKLYFQCNLLSSSKVSFKHICRQEWHQCWAFRNILELKPFYLSVHIFARMQLEFPDWRVFLGTCVLVPKHTLFDSVQGKSLTVQHEDFAKRSTFDLHNLGPLGDCPNILWTFHPCDGDGVLGPHPIPSKRAPFRVFFLSHLHQRRNLYHRLCHCSWEVSEDCSLRHLHHVYHLRRQSLLPTDSLSSWKHSRLRHS